MLQNNVISKMTSEVLLSELLAEENCLSPSEIVKKKNLKKISDERELFKICLQVLENNKDSVIAYRQKNKKSIFNHLIEEALKETNMCADTKVLPQIMKKVLQDLIEEGKS